MAVTNCETLTSDEPATFVTPRRTRIDPPHAAGPAGSVEQATDAQPLDAEIVNPFLVAAPCGAMLEVEEPTAEMIAAVTGENVELRREQLQLQVAQLAGHLRERLGEGGRREATLHARMAQLGSDPRRA